MGDITIKNFRFLSSNKYYTIHGKMWIPKGKVKAIVQISHGMAEYIERYDGFAGFLADKGILVVGNDHMGHGQSINDKDDLGYFSVPFTSDKGICGGRIPCRFFGSSNSMLHSRRLDKFSSSSLVVCDLLKVTKMVKKRYPGVPYILLGHSMGSFIARRYMMEYGDELDGAIIMGTGNQPKHTVLAAGIICEIAKIFRGDRHRSRLIDRLMFGSYNNGIDNPSGKNAWLSTDEEQVAKYDADDKCGFIFTLNGLSALFSTIRFVQREKNIARLPKDIRILIVSGDRDPVGGFGAQVKEVYRIYSEHGVKDISLKLYEGCRHEILNETIKESVYEDIYQWIKCML